MHVVIARTLSQILDSRIEEQVDYLSCSITRLSHNERNLLVRYRMKKKE